MTTTPDKDCVVQFLDLVDSTTRQKLEQLPDLHELIADLCTGPKQAWPDVEVPPAVFLRYIADRISTDLPLERALRNLRVDELYLCCACAAGDPRAVETFHDRFAPVIWRTIGDLRLGDALPQDVSQHVLDALLVPTKPGKPPLIAAYSGVGQLARWLRVITARNARKLLQREKKLVLVGDEAIARRLVDRTAKDLAILKREYQGHFKAAFKKALSELPATEATLLRYRYADELGLEQIGAILRVHHSTVLRRLEKVKSKLLDRTRALLQERLDIGREECQSIIRLIQSDINLTLQTFLSGDRNDGSEPREGA